MAQKNTLELGRRTAARASGSTSPIAEECGRYRECRGYTAIYGNHVIDVEYGRRGFPRRVRRGRSPRDGRARDRDVSTPASPRYRYRAC